MAERVGLWRVSRVPQLRQWPSSQGPEPVLATGDLLDPHAVVPINHHYFAPGNEALVDQHLDLLADAAVQLDNRTRRQLQDVLHGQLRLTERNTDWQIDVQQQIHGAGARR